MLVDKSQGARVAVGNCGLGGGGRVQKSVSGDAAENGDLSSPTARWTFVSNDQLQLFPFHPDVVSFPEGFLAANPFCR